MRKNLLRLFAAQEGAHAGGIQTAHPPAQPHRGPDPRHPRHGRERRLLPGHSRAVGGSTGQSALNAANCSSVMSISSTRKGCRASAHPNGRFFQHIIPACGHQYPPAGRKAPPQEKTCGGVFLRFAKKQQIQQPAQRYNGINTQQMTARALLVPAPSQRLPPFEQPLFQTDF